MEREADDVPGQRKDANIRAVGGSALATGRKRDWEARNQGGQRQVWRDWACGQSKAHVIITGEEMAATSAWAVNVAQWVFLRVHPRLRVSRRVVCWFLPGAPRV